MPKAKPLNVGQRFGRWTVIGENQGSKTPCRCDCGVESLVFRSNLIGGKTLSCGCLMREKTSAAAKTHGMSRTPEYGSWLSMNKRCYNPKYIGFDLYGGRGITVCAEWRHSFEQFYADLGPRPANCSLDRIDPNGNYEPENCRWATPTEQSFNQRLDRKHHGGVRGVSFDRQYGKWRAVIYKNGKRAFSEFFDNKDEAIAARKQYEMALNATSVTPLEVAA